MSSAGDVARLRQGLYRFFGGTMLPPEPVRMEALLAAGRYLETMGIPDYSFSRQWESLMHVMDVTATADSLAAEYVKLFASSTDAAFCPPCESYYVAAGDGAATAEVVTELQGEYHRLGLVLTTATAPADHAATQLEVMSMLCAREASAWQTGDVAAALAMLATESHFLRRHLGKWFPKLRSRVRASTAGPLYRSLVDSIHAFLIHDRDLIHGLRRDAGVLV